MVQIFAIRSPAASDLDGIFAAHGWLAEHPAAFRARLFGMAVTTQVAPGEMVYREGDESHGLYGVISGAIGVEGGHARQTPLLGHIHRPGGWFGIKAALHGGPRELTYRAIEPTRLLIIPNARLVPLMRTDADVAIRVGQLGEYGGRISARTIRDLLTPDATRRLASVLVRVLGMGEVAPDDPKGFWLTHQQIGEMANLSRHHVGRKLASFEANGWIACGYNRILLRDCKALADFAYADEHD
jgi:CRP/FNR family transcriptional regulator, cyclic AMP receptor protein